MIAIHLSAINDKNGNPRRVYVIIRKDGSIEAAIDEGYSGRAAVEQAGYDRKLADNACTFSTTPKEYKNLLAKNRPWKVFHS